MSDLFYCLILVAACAVFLRWGCIRETSRTEGTARSQGERGCGGPKLRTPCRDCEDVR